ncbi:MAG: ECF-type sigma factor [Planctomycetota bacterium]
MTQLLAMATGGDPQAAARLLPLVYDELRRLAHQRMAREPAGLTLQPTALVHEAYVRLVDAGDVEWRSRGHFFGAAAEAMRRILVERARRYGRQKHGGGRRRLDLDRLNLAGEAPSQELLALDEALVALDEEDKVAGDVVKLRFFAGLTIEQTAEVLGLSTATVSRHWTFARTWLYQQIANGQGT